uniref:tRNA (guanine(37)-N1)-methyltransferase n=1 Tax=Capra hircus TaxID=9925 RepID=A0A8C2NJC2_CAPHI
MNSARSPRNLGCCLWGPGPKLLPSPLAIPFLFPVLFGSHFRTGSQRSKLTLLSNGLDSSASASSGSWVETNQPGSALVTPAGTSMLLAGRLPSPSTSCYPCPPACSRAGGGPTFPALPGSRTSPGPGRKEGSTCCGDARLTAANLDGVIEGPPTRRRHVSELYQSMSLLKQFGFSRRLLKVASCRITESASLVLLPWASLIQKLSRVPVIFLLDQRKRFSTMPEIETNHRDSELFSPPSDVRGMIELDRTAFKKTVTIPVLKVRKEVVNKLMRSLKRAALQRPGIKRVIEDPEDEEGQVMIDKNPGITSAVNKINNIDNTYRNFEMEVLSGEENMMTKVRENNYTYEFDFSKVYWNPRLSTEHSRITELLKPGDVLFDVFAGVGPFAIPAAKKNCTVFANDLNPESHKWLLHNCKLNKVDQKVKVFNLDGKDFLRGPVREELMQQLGPLSKERKHSVHIVMNLPAKAIEFLSACKALLDGQPCGSELLPIVHCYSFSKDANPAKDVQQRAGTVLGISLEACSSVHLVRNVAPNKEMLCITFQIPAAILYKNQTVNRDNHEDPPLKRQRTDKDF